ncbi:transcription initiation protein spt4 [Clavulina sp. PMI_390]|nr:transcription initiation protein spt4 [Clavulina sp. PMI_390]
MDSAPIPGQKAKNLRACLLCSIVMSSADFRKHGCPNCDEIIQLQGAEADKVLRATSAQFDGVIALTNPTDSWVARWQRVGTYVKGLYAVRVTGRIPPSIQEQLDQRGITYRPRDTIQDD